MDVIKIYDVIRVTKNVITRSMPSLEIPKDSTGTVLEIVANPTTGETEYLIELDNETFGAGQLEYLRRDEIEPVSQK